LRAALVGTGLVFLGAVSACDDDSSAPGEGDAFVNPPTPDRGPPPAPTGTDWDARLADARAAEGAYFGDDVQGPRLLGERYLARIAPGAEPDAIADLLGPTIALLDAEDADQAALAVAAQVADDFAALRVTTQDGWMLSQTELHLCALAYLASPA
jgi:hypothetical protein